VFAVETFACGEVVAQVTLPDVFVHEYHEPPLTSCALTTRAVVGLIVNATWSIDCGLDALSV
jgi:hypothetical protein